MSVHGHMKCRLTAGGIVLCACLAATSAVAQVDTLQRILGARATGEIQLVDADRDVDDTFKEVGAMVRTGRLDRAAEILQTLVHADKVVLLPRWENPRQYMPSTEVATRILGLLPDAVLERVNRQDESAARRHFDEASRDWREDLLASTGTKYFHTVHGAEALNVLAAMAFDRGAYLDASYAWERLYAEQRVSRVDRPLMLAKAAVAAHLGGWRTKAERLSDTLRINHGEAKAVIAGREQNLLTFLRESLSTAKEPVVVAPVVSEWSTVAGVADTFAVMQDCAVSPLVLWKQSEVSQADNVASMLQLEGGRDDSGQTRLDAGVKSGRVNVAIRRPGEAEFSFSLPAIVHPVVLANRLVCRREQGLVAVSPDTGREMWKVDFPLYRGTLTSRAVNQYLPVAGDVGRYTLTAGDGLLFAVGKFRRLNPETYRKFAGSGDEDASTLAAFSSDTGALLWEVGNGKGDGESIQRAKFLAAPAHHAGRVFAIAKVGNRYHAICLDARTGRRVWDVAIGPIPSHSGEQMSWQAAYTMEIMTERASVPSVANGILYLTTNAGLIVALDENTGAPVWAYRYNSRVVTESDNGRSFEVANMAFLISSSRRPFPPQNPVLVVRGRVIAAPSDSDTVLALHGRSGELLWEVQRKGLRDLSAVDGGRVLLSGPTMLFLGVTDGAVRGQVGTYVEDRPAVTSKAVVAGGRGLMVRVNLSDYAVSEFPVTDPQALIGRFVVTGQRFAAVNGAGVCVYSGFDDAWNELSSRLESAKDPAGRVDLMVQRGVLALQADKAGQAVTSLRSAFEVARTAKQSELPAVKQWLNRALVRAAKASTNQVEAFDLLSEAEGVAEGTENRFEVTRARVYAEERFGRPQQAMEIAQRISETIGDSWVSIGEASGEGAEVWATGYQWGQSETARFLRQYGRDLYGQYNRNLSEVLEQGARAGDVEGMLAAQHRWPHADRADELLYRCAEAILRGGGTNVPGLAILSRADRVLGAIGTNAEWNVRGAAAQALLDIRYRPMLAPGLNAVAASLPANTQVSFWDYQGTVADLRRQATARLESDIPSFASLTGRVAFLSAIADGMPSVLRTPDGGALLPGDRLLCIQDERSVRCVNAQGGDISASVWQAPMPVVQPVNGRSALYCREKNVVTVLTPEHIVVLDAGTGKECARRTTRELGVYPWTRALGDGTHVVLANERQDWIVSLGVPSATVEWRVRGEGFSGELLATGCDQVLVCRGGNRAVARVLDIRTGRQIFSTGEANMQTSMNQDGFCLSVRDDRPGLIEFHDPRQSRLQPFLRVTATNVAHDIVGFGERYAVVCEQRDRALLKLVDVAEESPLRVIRISPESVTNTVVSGLAWTSGSAFLACGEPGGLSGTLVNPRLVALDLIGGRVLWQMSLRPEDGGSRKVLGPNRYGGLLSLLVISPDDRVQARHLVVDSKQGVVVADLVEPFGASARMVARTPEKAGPPVVLNGRLVLETGRGLLCFGTGL